MVDGSSMVPLTSCSSSTSSRGGAKVSSLILLRFLLGAVLTLSPSLWRGRLRGFRVLDRSVRGSGVCESDMLTVAWISGRDSNTPPSRCNGLAEMRGRKFLAIVYTVASKAWRSFTLSDDAFNVSTLCRLRPSQL